MQSARDSCEEYIAARIWPLKKGWSFIHFHEKIVRGKSYIFPDNESFRPKKYSEDAQFVSAVETKVVEILGKFLKKEKDLMDKILGRDYKRLNKIFDIAQIKYGERPLPAYTRTLKLSIENVTKKKRVGGQLSKKITKKKKVDTSSGSKKLGGDGEEMSLETLSQLARDEEVRMISLVFNSSGLTLLMLTPLGDCFQNLEANVHSNVNLDEAILSSSQINVGKDILSSPVVGVQVPVGAAAAEDVVVNSQEEGEIAILTSQETAGPSSQRFVAKTPSVIVGAVSPPKVVAEENIVLEGGPMETGAPKVRVLKAKGTTTVTFDFDESDDDVFDEEAKNARASRLSESIIDVNTGEKVACHLEKRVTIGNYCIYIYILFVFVF
jgi:hypothetical protein